MTISKYERNNTIKTEVDFKVGTTLTDPSGSKAFVSVIRSNGTYLASSASTTREGTGEYYYYFSTTDTDPLGIYIVEWKGNHSLGGIYGYKPIIQRSVINIVDVD